MRFWIWIGRVRSLSDAATKLLLFVSLAAAVNHLRAVLVDYPFHHGFGTSLFDAAFVAVPIGCLGLTLLSRLGRLQDELQVLASTDALTQLPNRRSLMERLGAHIANRRQGVFLMADIDYFKRINDTYGHGGGDDCLQQIADLLRRLFDEAGDTARIGGKEFAIFMPDTTVAQAMTAARALAQGTGMTFSGVTEHITLSVGVTQTRPDDDIQDLMRRADEALYFAKAQGRARAVDWHSDARSSVLFKHVSNRTNTPATR